MMLLILENTTPGGTVGVEVAVGVGVMVGVVVGVGVDVAVGGIGVTVSVGILVGVWVSSRATWLDPSVGETTATGKPSLLSPENRFEKYDPPNMIAINPSKMIAAPPYKNNGFILGDFTASSDIPPSTGGGGD